MQNLPFAAFFSDLAAFLTTDLMAVVAKLGIAAGLLGSIWGFVQQKKVLQTYVALDFFKRYEAWNEAAPYEVDEARLLDGLSDSVRKEVLHSILRYTNLCSEEFALHEAGRVPNDIWKIWDHGIRGNFQQPLWQQAWAVIRHEYASMPDFQTYIDRHCSS